MAVHVRTGFRVGTATCSDDHLNCAYVRRITIMGLPLRSWSRHKEQGQGSGFAQQSADRRKRLRRFAPPPFPSVCRGLTTFRLGTLAAPGTSAAPWIKDDQPGSFSGSSSAQKWILTSDSESPGRNPSGSVSADHFHAGQQHRHHLVGPGDFETKIISPHIPPTVSDSSNPNQTS